MIASLGMYDLAPVQAANDRYWALIREGLVARGIEAPLALTRGEGAYWPAWQSADLLLSHTCGYPYRARLHGAVTLVGTPDFGQDGCPPGHYFSVFVTRKDDPRSDLAAFRTARFAYNEPLSQSGWAAPQNHAARNGLRFAPHLQTGGHALSMQAVAEGRADFAALDSVTWTLLQRHDPQADMVREIARTASTPGLPYITAKGRDPEPIFAAIAEAIAALSPADRDTLLLRGVVRIPAEAYLAVPNPPAPDQFAQEK
jgi:ABC-type phosphate/phosphonate transport system substrate-binding protein